MISPAKSKHDPSRLTNFISKRKKKSARSKKSDEYLEQNKGIKFRKIVEELNQDINKMGKICFFTQNIKVIIFGCVEEMRRDEKREAHTH